jgi:protein TonB
LRTPPTPPLRIVDAVFGQGPRARAQPAVAALTLAIAVHAVFWLWARRREPSLAEWSAALATRIHAELARREVVDLLPPPKPSTPQQLPPQVRPSAPHAPRPKGPPPPPAQAGRIVAQEPHADMPVDLTKETFVTGNASAYAGGTTTARGTNPVAVPTASTDPNARPTLRPGEPDRGRPVTLGDDEWRCPWPSEADTEQIDEQVVIIRVKVRADGTAAAVRLVADPGHGFGPAAIACALATRYSPARDQAGHAIDADSPPIRVRFTR